ncbi:hypothetical protein K432DRAFT_378884 [Lepidopterella palustris CBS 459.81]|uniref:Uncharacterized protein n=1 Tax=Lepidopterella palustris CBS 459.81 TaxID=1314670 RepID=A0A8E2JJ08_9PEZI|nr:hypothetical protein K432DRAFT_378884 [Lepidopterella palustris CBS 459.81]
MAEPVESSVCWWLVLSLFACPDFQRLSKLSIVSPFLSLTGTDSFQGLLIKLSLPSSRAPLNPLFVIRHSLSKTSKCLFSPGSYSVAGRRLAMASFEGLLVEMLVKAMLYLGVKNFRTVAMLSTRQPRRGTIALPRYKKFDEHSQPHRRPIRPFLRCILQCPRPVQYMRVLKYKDWDTELEGFGLS